MADNESVEVTPSQRWLIILGIVIALLLAVIAVTLIVRAPEETIPAVETTSDPEDSTTTTSEPTTTTSVPTTTTTTSDPTTTTTTSTTTTTTSSTTTSTTTTTIVDEGLPDPFPVTVGDVNAFGVSVGADAETTITELTSLLGPPTNDTGWWEGCPLDGPGDNERLVEWGQLWFRFTRLDTGDEYSGWEYFPSAIAAPSPDQVIVPDGFFADEAFATVVESYGEVPVVDDVFATPLYFADNYTLVGASEVDQQITHVGTPFVAFCE